jgi:hypothetical protein
MNTITSDVSTIPLAISFRSGVEHNSRNRLEDVFGAHVDSLLSGAEKVAEFHHKSFVRLLSSFNLHTIPQVYADEIRKSAQELAYFGLYTDCLLYDYPNRLNFSVVNPEQLFADWLPKTLNANSFMRASDKANVNWPSAIFECFYPPVDAIQKKLGLGRFQRHSNENKFKNLFASGMLLGAFHDCVTQGIPYPE